MTSVTVSVLMIGLTALILALNAIIACRRGIRSGLLHLGASVLALVIAFLGRNAAYRLLEKSLNLKGLLENLLGDGFSALVGNILPIVEMISKLLLFILLYLASFLLLSIPAAIGTAVLSKKSKEKQSRIPLRLLLGLLLGVTVLVGTVFPLQGILNVGGRLIGAVNSVADSFTKLENPLEPYTFLTEYSGSSVGKFYSSVSRWIVRPLTDCKDENGKAITLDGQLDGIVATSRLASALTAVSDLRFDGSAEKNADDMRELFNSLDNVKNGLSEESMDVLQNIVSAAADSLLKKTGVHLDLGAFDFSAVNFAKEGAIVTALLEEKPDYAEIAEMMSDSVLIRDVVKSTDQTIAISEEQKQEVVKAVNNLPELDEEIRKGIFKIFNIDQ